MVGGGEWTSSPCAAQKSEWSGLKEGQLHIPPAPAFLCWVISLSHTSCVWERGWTQQPRRAYMRGPAHWCPAEELGETTTHIVRSRAEPLGRRHSGWGLPSSRVICLLTCTQAPGMKVKLGLKNSSVWLWKCSLDMYPNSGIASQVWHGEIWFVKRWFGFHCILMCFSMGYCSIRGHSRG